MKAINKSLLKIATCTGAVGLASPLIIGATLPQNENIVRGQDTIFISKGELTGQSELYWTNGNVANWGFDGVVPEGFSIADDTTGIGASCRIKWESLTNTDNFDLRLKYDTHNTLIHVVFIEADKFVNLSSNSVKQLMVGTQETIQLTSDNSDFDDYDNVSLVSYDASVQVNRIDSTNWNIIGKRNGASKLQFTYTDTNNTGWGARFNDAESVSVISISQINAGSGINGPDQIDFVQGSTDMPSFDSFSYSGAKSSDIGFRLAYPAYANGTDPGYFGLSTDTGLSAHISPKTGSVPVGAYPIVLNYYTDNDTIAASKDVILNVMNGVTFSAPQTQILFDTGHAATGPVGKEYFIGGGVDATGRYWLGNSDNTAPYSGSNFALEPGPTGVFLKVNSFPSGSVNVVYVNWEGPLGTQRIAQPVTIYADQISGPTGNDWKMDVGEKFSPKDSQGKILPYSTAYFTDGAYSATSDVASYSATFDANNEIIVQNTTANAAQTTLTVSYSIKSAPADWTNTKLVTTIQVATNEYQMDSQNEIELMTAYKDDNQKGATKSDGGYRAYNPNTGSPNPSGVFTATQLDNNGNPINPSFDNNNNLNWQLPPNRTTAITNGYISILIEYKVNAITVTSQTVKLYVCTLSDPDSPLRVLKGTSSFDAENTATLKSNIGLASLPNFATNPGFKYEITSPSTNYITAETLGTQQINTINVFPYTTDKTYADSNTITITYTLTFANSQQYSISRDYTVNVFQYNIIGDDIVLFSAVQTDGQIGSTSYSTDAPTDGGYNWRLVNSDGTPFDTYGIYMDEDNGKLYYNQTTTGDPHYVEGPLSWSGTIEAYLEQDPSTVISSMPLQIVALNQPTNIIKASVYPNGVRPSAGGFTMPQEWAWINDNIPFSVPDKYGRVISLSLSNPDLTFSKYAYDGAGMGVGFSVCSSSDKSTNYPYTTLSKTTASINVTNGAGHTYSVPIDAPLVEWNNFGVTGGFGGLNNPNGETLPFDDFILKLDGKTSTSSITGPSFTIGNRPTDTPDYNWLYQTKSDNGEFVLTKDSSHENVFNSKYTPDPNRSGIKAGNYSIMQNNYQTNEWGVNKKINLINKSYMTYMDPDNASWNNCKWDWNAKGSGIILTDGIGYELNEITAYPGIDPSDNKQKIHMKISYDVAWWSYTWTTTEPRTQYWARNGAVTLEKEAWYEYSQTGSGATASLVVKQNWPESGDWVDIFSFGGGGQSVGRFTFTVTFSANSLRVNVDWTGRVEEDEGDSEGTGNVDVYNSNY